MQGVPTSESWSQITLAAHLCGTFVVGGIEEGAWIHALFLNGYAAFISMDPYPVGILQMRWALGNYNFPSILRHKFVLRGLSATYLVQFLRSTLRLLGIVSSLPRMIPPLLVSVMLLSSFYWTFQTCAPSRTMDSFSIPKPPFPMTSILSHPTSWHCLARRDGFPNIVS